MSDEQQVSVSRTIAASPETIFAVLTDPDKHPVIDGSGTVKGERFGPERLELGSKFGMKMKMYGFPYRMTSEVVEYEPARKIAWCHFGKHRWRYELEPTDGGTVVTETFDWSTARSPKFIEMMGYPKSHVSSMEKTLERLDEHVTSAS